MNENPPEILTSDNTDVSLRIPLLPKGEYVLTVAKVDLVKTDKGTDLVKISLKTTEPSLDVTGQETLKANFPLFDQISLTPTENYTKENIQKRITAFQRACGFSTGPFWPLDKYVGKSVKAVLRVDPARDGYDEKNSIGRYVVPKS